MHNRDRRQEISEEQAERLLGDATPSLRLAPDRREALWQALAKNLNATPSARRPQWPTWKRMSLAAGAAAAAVLVFLVIGLFGSTQPRIATATSVSGPCTISAPGGKAMPLEPGTRVLPGQTVQVGRRAAATLALPDETRIDLRENTRALYSGLRRRGQTSVRLLRGEMRAHVRPGSDPFEVGTPVALLRVLGTDFHCRAYSGTEWNIQPKEERDMRKASAIPGVALLLTVLSGAVEVNAAQASYTVSEGHRALVTAHDQDPAVLQLARNGYSKNWLNGSAELAPEVLFPVTLEPNVLAGLRAFNIETGNVREVTDCLGAGIEVIEGAGGGVALVQSWSLIFSYFGGGVLGGAGQPLVNNALYLVNTQTGEKLAVPSLAEYDPLYMQLSPDRRRLAFVGHRTAATDKLEFGLFVADLETLEVKRLVEGAFKTAPCWSPDSRWLALSLAEGYLRDVAAYPISLVDSLTGEVVETPYFGADVHFTPDGAHLLFAGGFKSSGSWMRGVPSSGNLFLATLPDGPAEPLTSLPEGGAVMPSLSPDGAYVAYWVEKTLHVLNLETRADEQILDTQDWCRVDWLGDRRFVVGPLGTGDPNEPLRVVRLGEGAAAVAEYRPEAPTMTPEAEGSVHQAVDELQESFRLYGQAVEAQDLHRIEEAVGLYGRARDAMAGIAARLDKEQNLPGLLLAKVDVQPYLAMLEKEAAMTPAERTVQVVETNLKEYVYSLLRNYCRVEKRLPEDFRPLIGTALALEWQINHIRSTDTERAKRLFVIPGDDPDAVVTSYEQVEADPEGKRLVLRTPVLPDGTRIQAAYALDAEGNLTVNLTRPE